MDYLFDDCASFGYDGSSVSSPQSLYRSPSTPDSLEGPNMLYRQLSNSSSSGAWTPGSSPTCLPMSFQGNMDEAMDRQYTPSCAPSPSAHEVSPVSFIPNSDWTRYQYTPDDDGGFWMRFPGLVPQENEPLHFRHADYMNMVQGPISPTSSPRRRQEQGSETTARYQCFQEECKADTFKRHADLVRHYAQLHTPRTKKKTYPCDYPKCPRRSDPFGRMDHFRDHIREYHREDICKRGGKMDEAWLQKRQVSRNWWRCSKCLDRLNVADYTCPQCKSPCEEERQALRRLRYGKSPRSFWKT